jgi:hypothetical protein
MKERFQWKYSVTPLSQALLHDPYFLTLGPHGFYWFLLTPRSDADTESGVDIELPVFEVRTRDGRR